MKTRRSEWLFLAGAILLPLIAGYLGDRSGISLTASQKHEALYILAFERHPWHYVPWTWSGETWSVWGLLLALGLWARREVGVVRVLDAFAGVSIAFTVLGWISIWWQPLWPLAKLQPFRMTIWLELASFAYLAIFLGRRLASADSAQRLSVMTWLWFVFFTTQDVIFRKHFFLAVVVLIVSEIGLRRIRGAVWIPLLTVMLLIAVGRGRSTHLLIWLYAVPSLVLLGGARALFNIRVRPLLNLLSLSGLSLLVLVFLTPLSKVRGEPHVIVASFNVSRYPEGPIRDMAQWAKVHTKPDALFLTPPQDGNFRLSARRAIVVNFKTFAWGDKGLLDWRQRISDVTGNVPLKLGDGYYLELRDKYNALSPAQIAELQRKYKFDYAIVSESKQLKWPVVFQTRGWKVYKTT